MLILFYISIIDTQKTKSDTPKNETYFLGVSLQKQETILIKEMNNYKVYAIILLAFIHIYTFTATDGINRC